jgi:hypothetical protein
MGHAPEDAVERDQAGRAQEVSKSGLRPPGPGTPGILSKGTFRESQLTPGCSSVGVYLCLRYINTNQCGLIT